MTQFINNDVASGNIVKASDHNTQGALLAAVINGNIDSGNISDNAVIESKIADGSIAGSKLGTDATFLGYAQTTGSFSTSSTSAIQVPDLSSTVSIPTGRRVKITAYASDMYSSASPGYNTLTIWDGPVGSGTQLARCQNNLTNTTGQSPAMVIAVPPTPVGGTKTYNVGLHTSSGTVNIEAGVDFPAFILVEPL